MTDLTLTVERTINAPQVDVFNAWLNPDMLRRFMMPAAGMSVSKALTEPRIGGRFHIVMQSGETEIPHTGIYREIVPNNRIVFTWESPYSVENSLVTLTFAPVTDGTKVTLTHIRFSDAETRDNHSNGWASILKAFEDLLN
jgi:uncharacterized protein YndB with AHSA1/START domain